MAYNDKSRLRRCCCWSLLVVVIGLIAIAILVIVQKRNGSGFGFGFGGVNQNYSNALKLTMKYFDVQKSGKLVNNDISWRGDSALKDGNEVKLDLSKGMYDAGDHMKFGFPMAFTATVLSWAILEYGDRMDVANQLKPAQNSLKWITDYLANAHSSDNVLYVQVGDPVIDHGCWDRPEDMTEARPVLQVNVSYPGSDVAAETAAAMASASLVFKSIDSAYSSSLLQHAEKLFVFADKHRGSYSKSIPSVKDYYDSTGYGDELLWAASWLFHATGDVTYLDYVKGENGEEFASWGKPTWFSWDDKRAATQVLLSRISFFGSKSNAKGLDDYKSTADAVMCGLLPNSPTATDSRNANGLIWISEWNALQHPISSSFLAVLYSDYMIANSISELSCDGEIFSPSDLRTFAISQVDYVLGENPMKMSYLVGYGDKYPKYVHHRGSSIPADAKTGCKDGWKWLSAKGPNPNVAIGAVVGGPFLNETYIDSRNNSIQGEPSTYNSALMVGVLSGLITTSNMVTSFS
ncbi:endoglucanase 2-like [Impatiens glandulifera]|uniref:endoglucanase 2-like n=1 Tax=Impatiens glandulifera TaxID=253017 RepID=UPI001FB0A1EE|nr:endoglucanase 2-like [Impatiens glandulifera]